MIAETDQLMAYLRDAPPRILWNFFTGCMEKGFTRTEALELSKVLTAQFATIVFPNNTITGNTNDANSD